MQLEAIKTAATKIWQGVQAGDLTPENAVQRFMAIEEVLGVMMELEQMPALQQAENTDTMKEIQDVLRHAKILGDGCRILLLPPKGDDQK